MYLPAEIDAVDLINFTKIDESPMAMSSFLRHLFLHLLWHRKTVLLPYGIVRAYTPTQTFELICIYLLFLARTTKMTPKNTKYSFQTRICAKKKKRTFSNNNNRIEK